jgi:hypothetical protein
MSIRENLPRGLSRHTPGGMEYYWETFHAHLAAILAQPEITSISKESVFKTFQMSFNVLKEQNFNAARLTFVDFVDNYTISSEAFLDNGEVAKQALAHDKLFQKRDRVSRHGR